MPGEPFEAASVLDEMYGDAGLLLWSVMRGVDLVVGADDDDRGELFAPGAMSQLRRWIDGAGDVDETLRGHMVMLANLLGDAAPEMTRVSEACAAIADWASNGGFGRCAYVAALRGAAASPREPAYAYQAGIMARRIADYPRAEAWLKRTSVLAKRSGDQVQHGAVLMSLASLHLIRFEHDKAVSKLHQVLRLARRYALWELRPKAYHDLFCLAAAEGMPKQAARYALSAARGYGRINPGARRLAHDLALFLLLHDRAPPALRVLQSLNYTALRSADWLIALATIGRAAGMAGDLRIYFEVWSEFWKRLDGVIEYDRTAEALILLAWGAASLRDATRLEVAAREALRIATPRGEEHEVLQAKQMLASLSNGDFPEPEGRVRGSPEDLRDAITAAELLLRDMLRWPHVRAPEAGPAHEQTGGHAHPGAQGARTIRKLARRLPG